MDIVRKNLLSILCGVVTLFSVGAIFWPINSTLDQVRADLDASAKMSSDMAQCLRQGRSCRLPVVEPDQTEPPTLKNFPTQKVYEAGHKVILMMKEMTASQMSAALAANRKDPLTTGALPDFTEGSARPRVKKMYYEDMRKLWVAMNGGRPPRPEDVQERANAEWEKRLRNVPAVGGQRIAAQVDAMRAKFEEEVVPQIPVTVATDWAQQYSIYISERGLHYHPGMPPEGDAATPQLPDVWWAHVGYWIQKDLAQAIVTTNNTRSTPSAPVRVSNAIVKRLVHTYVTPGFLTPQGLTQSPSGGPGQPGLPFAPAPAGGAAAGATRPPAPPGGIARAYHLTATGRVSNSVYDVVPFTFTVDVEAANCRALLANLTNGRFITVTNVALVGLDREAVQRAGMIYGPEPVVQMTVEAEAVFFRDWTVRYMPADIKVLLGLANPDNQPKP